MCFDIALCRDVQCTERLDYLSANSMVFNGVILSVARVFRLQRSGQWIMLGAPIVAIMLAHFHYMLNVKFDYGWNMRLCIGLGALQALTWVVGNCAPHILHTCRYDS